MIDFVYWGNLNPVDNGFKSTASNLIEQLNSIDAVRAFSLVWRDASNTSGLSLDDQWFQERKIAHYRIALLRPGLRRHLSAPLFGISALFLGAPNRWIEELRRSPLGTEGARVVFFGTGWDPLPIDALREYPGASFMPADSITVFEKSRSADDVLSSLRRSLTEFLAKIVERRMLKACFRAIFYVTASDAKVAMDLAPDEGGKVHVVPIGIKPEDYSAPRVAGSSVDRPPSLLFGGVIEYTPNKLAAEFLAREIFPRLMTPNVRLRIVGKGGSCLSQLRSETIVVEDWVDDMRKVQGSADLFISPVKMGAGAKNNVLQALASGTPVVGTAKSFRAFESLPPGAYVAETAEEFARTIDELLSDRVSLEAVGAAAKSHVLSRYTWKASAICLEALLPRGNSQPARHAVRPFETA